jgi:nitrile hydratase accessory protein
MRHEALRDLPGIPLDADSPVFNEPWEARAFAMALALHERGVFTWWQWAEALSRQIELAHAAGDADLGDTYYQHWLRALESLVQNLKARSPSE